ncbi:MAG: nucleotidyl transferase AbiEii/AbiGii toxin family protein [Kiritimatiellae bacterium]|nr:nucleotidyl transferase AbiEii/AbiGii toxin family protein [Kiritimatiellia bacterium]
MIPPPSAPQSRRLLDIAIDRLAASSGDPVRLRRLMANVVIGQMLPPTLCVKGGSALKFRYGDAATRFTRDLDLARATDLPSAVRAVRDALRRGWCGFDAILAPRRQAAPPGVPAPYLMAPFAAKLSYNGKPWLTVDLEIGHDELGDADAFDEAIPSSLQDLFERLGFPRPRPIPVMGILHQIDQKLHAVTEPGSRRAHDLLDLQLLLDRNPPDYSALKRLCRRLFAYRKRHAWPPAFDPSPDWPARYDAQKTDLPVLPSFEDAARWLRDLIRQIDDAP